MAFRARLGVVGPRQPAATAKRGAAALAQVRAPKRARLDSGVTVTVMVEGGGGGGGDGEDADAADPIEEVPLEVKEEDKVFVSKHYRRMDGTPASAHRNVPVEDDVVRYLYARFSEAWRTRVPMVHPRDARIRFDDSIDPRTGKHRHDYYIDDVLQRSGFSVTGLKDALFPAFNKASQSRFSAARGAKPVADGKAPGKYAGKTGEQVLNMWERTSIDGREKHAFFEHFLTAGNVLAADGTLLPTDAPIPHGFFRFLLDHPELDVVRCEWQLFDPATGLRGTADLVVRNRATGAYILVDWKNCGGAFDKATTKTGSHYLTRTLPDNKLGGFTIQFNAYREMLERDYAVPIAQMFCVNFDPDRLNYYALYEVPRFDMVPIFALFPWDRHDLRHLPPDPAGRPFLLEPLRDDDARGEGPTSVARVKTGVPVLPPNVVWTGHAAKSKPQFQVDADGKDVLDTNGEKVPKFNPYAYDLPDSPWRPADKSFALKTSMLFKAYEAELLRDRARLERLVPELFGKTLLCWCGRKPDGTPEETCHNDVLAKYANALGSGALVLAPVPKPAINWTADDEEGEEDKINT